MPTEIKSSDPLLSLGRLIARVLMGLCVIVSLIMVVVLATGLTVQRSEMMDRAAAASGGTMGYPSILLAITLVIALMASAFLFLLQLVRMIGSVEQGDPFQPSNADRLRRMGWLTIVSQLILFILAWIGAGLDGPRPPVMIEDALNAAFGSVLLTIALFVLARIFRRGTEMRDELEGTI